ncbi:UbiD family decarboxylase [Poriferisphaera sp. WC338]|uniref:UbiD family decarboxylase n=1 Tax=Poriferisphaera sp. WC338 TaxID=3425129 RepID=UPI003D818524
MSYRTLQDFVAALESEGELARISAEVSPMLEVTEIADRVSKSPAAKTSIHAKTFDPLHANLGGKGLLFENVTGSSMPLLINAFGSYRRLELALGCADIGLEGLAAKVEQLVKPEPPAGIMEKMKKGLELAKIASFAPKVTKKGICQEVVKQGDEIDLLSLPVIKCWPDDGDPRKCGYPMSPQEAGTAEGEGRYITFAGIYTIHPDDASKAENMPRPSRNIGMYRAQLIDGKRTAMHWHIHHDGARHWRAWKKIGKPMPCAIVFGGESVLPYAATAPLPPGISELLFAGFLNNGSIPLVRCKTIDLHVPANAEMVIEGYVSTDAGEIGFDPRETPELGEGAVFEGPFGDHTGFYSLPDRYPIFEAECVTHRTNPIYPTTVVGLPPQEDYYLGKATERIFLPLLKTIVPDVIDYDLPMFGAFHNCAFLKIKKEYPLQARRLMHAIWGAGQMAWTKMLVIVDEDVDVHNHEEVMFHLCANVDPGRDVEIVNGPLDILDHAAPRLGAGHKIGFDATRKIKGEEVGGNPVRDWPNVLKMAEDIKEKVTQRWQEYGI